MTWLSHMLDVELFDLNAGGHHLTNVFLHAINTLLLFGFLTRATGSVGRSAMVAALFAVHPLHVESVAWISERKDVLSTLFMLLSLWAYLAWVKRRTLATYLLVAVALACGLMAKPMLVTLPFVLLLLDYWPLKRISTDSFHVRGVLPLIAEKLPLFALVIASSIITLIVQGKGGAIASTEGVSMGLRLANAAMSYVNYIVHMFYPVNLAVLYPYPESIPVWKSLASATLLTGLTIVAFIARKKLPYFAVGWLWYIGTLVPVIGIVQVGSQAMADRYTYVPLIGLFIILVWGVYDLLGKDAAKKGPLISSALLLLALLTGVAWKQTRFWVNSMTLWGNAIEVTDNNYRALSAYGSLLVDRGQPDQAIPYFKRAVTIDPGFARAQNKLGAALSDVGKDDEAIVYYQNAIRTQAEFAEAQNNLGNSLVRLGRMEEALEEYRNAISSKPAYALPYNGLGSALDDLGRLDEAIGEYQKAIELDPNLTSAHNNLAIAYYRKGDLTNARLESEKALQLEPDNGSYHYNMAVILLKSADTAKARKHLEKALNIDPTYQPALDALKTLPPTSNR
jgi:tetratricopeptide (TPR) repeat protein